MAILYKNGYFSKGIIIKNINKILQVYIVWVVECSKWNLTAIDTEKRINNDWNMKLLMLAKTQVENLCSPTRE